ncbi:MAG: formate--tetrahydrofolate ligase, partial [Bacteroidota bacterium]|nr:formate--tetrahydrofolate ligase [Bacteroidota bacterium]
VRIGLANLGRHIENVSLFGVRSIVAINHFPTDTEEEIQLIKDFCEKNGSVAVLAEGFAKGGNGMTALAEAVMAVADQGERNFKVLYSLDLSIKEKILKIAREIYRTENVSYSSEALTALKRIEKLGLEKLPVCIAKTQYSFSDDPALRNAPTGHNIHVNDIEIAAGAGFVVPILGKMMRMPGLPETPASEHMDIDNNGHVTGLS